MFPQRHIAGDRFPQRHVANEGVRMLLGKGLITVVIRDGDTSSRVILADGAYSHVAALETVTSSFTMQEIL
ncbi:hypothetical protein Tco_0420258, partial [Tanacetum coccineum]